MLEIYKYIPHRLQPTNPQTAIFVHIMFYRVHYTSNLNHIKLKTVFCCFCIVHENWPILYFLRWCLCGACSIIELSQTVLVTSLPCPFTPFVLSNLLHSLLSCPFILPLFVSPCVATLPPTPSFPRNHPLNLPLVKTQG